MDSETFFNDLKPWSKRKHRLLGKYLKPFVAKVASATSNREIYCVDAFAGTAEYKDGNLGSPLLMTQVSDECAEWKNPVVLRIINVEHDTENYEALKTQTEKWEKSGIVENIPSEFNDAIPKILETIQDAPALFFIDPFGSTSVYFSHLLPILERKQKITELITNFDTDGLYRIARASLSKNTDPKTAKTNEQHVTEILGTEVWKNELSTRNFSTNEGEDLMLQLYIQNLAKFGYHVVAYPIREALDKNPKYHFVYCTRHMDGVELMNDFVREEDDLIYGEYVEKDLPLFEEEASLAKEIINRCNKLRSVMEKYLESRKTITRKQAIKGIVKNNFGIFHSKDYRAIFKEFTSTNKLTTSDMGKKIDNRIYNFSPKGK